MKVEQLSVNVTFTEPVLASSPGNPELAQEYVENKAEEFRGERTPEEVEALKKEEHETLPLDVAEEVRKASTVFHGDQKGLFSFDYQWRGFFKEAISRFIELGEVTKLNPWNFRKAVDGCLYVFPRRIYFMRDGKHIVKPEGSLQRPLRAMTMRGERVGLANSQLIEAGATCTFDVHLLNSSNKKSSWSELTMDLLREALDAGQLTGAMQWRSGGYGRFTWKELKA